MKNMKIQGYFTTWLFTDNTCKKSIRVYYNDIDIASGDLLKDGDIVGNVKMRNLKMTLLDIKNNYMW